MHTRIHRSLETTKGPESGGVSVVGDRLFLAFFRGVYASGPIYDTGPRITVLDCAGILPLLPTKSDNFIYRWTKVIARSYASMTKDQ